MKVKKLISELQKFDPECFVYIFENNDYIGDLESIRSEKNNHIILEAKSSWIGYNASERE